MSDDSEPDSEPAAPVAVGDTIVEGRFTLLEQLGSGGSAVVYRAHDGAADEVVAVKVGRLPADADPQLRHQYQKMRRLHSPSIATCLGYFLHGASNALFSVLAFEVVDGVPLQQYVASVSRARRSEVARLIALALDELAVVGLRHGDLWTENILVRNAVPVLIDADSDGPGSALIHHGANDLTRFVDLLVSLEIADVHLERVLRGCAAHGRPFLAIAEALRVARIDAVASDRSARLAALRAAHARESSAGEGRYAALVTGRRAAFTELVRRVEEVLSAVDLSFVPFDSTAHDAAAETERKGTATGLGDLKHLPLMFRTSQGRLWDLLLRSHASFAKPSPFGDPTVLGIAQSTVRATDEAAEIDDVIALRTVAGTVRFSLETPYGWADLPDDWDMRSLETMLGHRIAAIPSHHQLQGPKQDPVAHGVDSIRAKLALNIARWLQPLAQLPRLGWKATLRRIFEEEISKTWAIWFASIARFDLVCIEERWYVELDALLADHAVTPVAWRFALPDLTPPASS